jgi:hypothetical protein
MGNELKVVERGFNGVRIQQREDGYWNATEICKANGKFWANYWSNKSAQAFVGELSSVIGIPITEIVQVRQAGDSKNQGTWVHRRVAIDLARWCSPKFAVLINGWVEELLTKGRLDLTNDNPHAKALAEIRNEQTQNRETMGQLATGLVELARSVAEIKSGRLIHIPAGVVWSIADRLFHYRWEDADEKQKTEIRDLARRLVLQHLGEQVIKQQRDIVFFPHQLGYLDQAIEFVRRKAERQKRDPGLFD